ncbi:MAG TPA: hypothetical protein VFZ16_03460 [Hyphomicrobiaceae bacterium]|nr:hypothetical protein [Hyphomicrobiaceae bacterium]
MRQAPTNLRPVGGIEEVMKLQTALAGTFQQYPSRFLRYAFINGLPGFVTIEAGDVLQTTALAIEGERIVGIYVTRNPDKLRHLRGGSA